VRHAPNVRANAWEDVADLAAGFGIVLDPWQENVLQAAMGERTDGTWAARQIAVSAPRQNGKSEIIVARALAGILLFDEQTIIVSAHQQDTAREVFSRILDLIDQFPALERRVESVMRAVNREYIRFTSGQSIRFKARSTGGGRGFSCDCLLLDEAQILGSAAWSAILPTMSARPNPQAWLLGTPPTENDDGEVFERLRSIGLDGKEHRVAYLEWSADPEAAIDDPETWASANPAYGTRIDHEAIATELASMSEEQFRLERLGMWPEHSRHIPVVKPSDWRALQSAGPETGVAPVALGVDMSHGLQISVAGAWVVGDSIHIEEVWAGNDVPAALRWIVAAAGRRTEVVIDNLSPAKQMIPELQAQRLKVKASTAGDMTKGCLMFETRVNTGMLSHSGQPQLESAVAGARKRPIGDAGGWGWDRRDATVSIHPLVAATLALLSASSTRRPTTGERISTRRGAVLL
jgi:phage terminase large subunit-like protein